MRIVIRSLNYSDLLAVTLPAWRRMLPAATIVVATGLQDAETVRVARENAALVNATDAWSNRGPKFLDGGAAADEAFGFQGVEFIPPEIGEVCISADADVYPVGEFPADLEPDTIYGCGQFYCPDQPTLDSYLSRERRLRDFELILPRSRGRESQHLPAARKRDVRAAAAKCVGYCIAWRHRKGLRLGSSKTAGGFDVSFRKKFATRAAMMSFAVLHLGERSRANWRGRVVPKWGGARP